MDSNILNKLSAITTEEEKLLQGENLNMQIYMSKKNRVIDSSKILEKGKLINIRAHTRFTDFPTHRHNYIEMMYMCQGETTHIINYKESMTIKKGEILLLNQHAYHSIKKANEADIAINFIILPEFFDLAFDMISSNNLLADFLINSLKIDNDEVSYIHLKVADILPVQNTIENLVWSIINHQPNNRNINQVTMGLLFLQFLNYTQYMSIPDKCNLSHSIVVEVLRDIEQNYKNTSLSQIAQRFNVSVAYLSKLIKEKTGYTYKQLLQQKRIAKAETLLINTTLSIQEIACAVGYDNISYFYSIFKNAHKKSPKTYRLELKD
ncbi:AraC family transcriptional regulator [Paludicola sp. MB14-C6]|uniref:AraC family transcriptional regulator n=1 Tax=Paludihabitans sp. MB14-C6 TaxID=3070656 RepID=UPI0027DB8528|nr:AraC family transcriptional regulator [Paludicola sp. MB14-C6]WMJ23173.1 AraC family transcriptional regulator [Paludicola sp. MB14-C6]